MSFHSLVRDSIFGQIVRSITGRRVFRYADELACPTAAPVYFIPQQDDPIVHPELYREYSSGKGTLNTETSSKSQSGSNLMLNVDLESMNTVSTDKSSNPRAWPTPIKVFVAFQICLYAFTVYLGSSIVLASLPRVILEYKVSTVVSSLTIAAYVFGYGAGAMFFSPLSEVPSLGRNIPYIGSFALFLVASAGAATSQSFGGLIVARFFQGLMGSPALATAGASMQDMFEIQHIPFAFTGWMGAACLGPALGPTISAFSVQAENWRWSLWEILWLASAVFLLMFTMLPETSAAKIQHDRRRRLRLPDVPATSQPTTSRFSDIMKSTFYRPAGIIFTQPAVAFANIYTCLIYGLYYTFFESVPLVYQDVYGFSSSQVGLCFLSISIGTFVGVAVFLPWAFSWVRAAKTMPPTTNPERCLVPALYASVTIPISLLIFAWTSRPSIHWVVSLLGIALYTASIFIVLECLANYLILVYPTHAASLFAGNDFMRASLAAGAILFSHPLYRNLGVGKGVSILAGATALCTVGMFWVYKYGAVLRERAGSL